MEVLLGQRDEDMERRSGQRQQGVGVGIHRPSISDVNIVTAVRRRMAACGRLEPYVVAAGYVREYLKRRRRRG